MDNQNKQRWIGGAILLGGGALMAALLLPDRRPQDLIPADAGKAVQNTTLGELKPVQNPTTNSPNDAAEDLNQTSATQVDAQATNTDALSPATAHNAGTESGDSLALDVETEHRMLEQQKQLRAKQVAEQEAKTAEFLARQQQAEADAARKAAEEHAARLAARQARDDASLKSTDPLAPELLDDPAAQDAARKAELKRQERERLQKQATERADEARQERDRAAKDL
jgi:hypothetical protein